MTTTEALIVGGMIGVALTVLASAGLVAMAMWVSATDEEQYQDTYAVSDE